MVAVVIGLMSNLLASTVCSFLRLADFVAREVTRHLSSGNPEMSRDHLRRFDRQVCQKAYLQSQTAQNDGLLHPDEQWPRHRCGCGKLPHHTFRSQRRARSRAHSFAGFRFSGLG